MAESYDHMYGARPLRRWLEHAIITPLSRMIISGQLPDDSKVVVDAPGPASGVAPGLSFTVLPDEAAAAARAAEEERRKSFKKLRLSPAATFEEGDADGSEQMED